MTAGTGGIAPSVTWAWRRFDRLARDDIYDMLALRSEVFVVEQQCVFLDADGYDRHAWHLLGRVAAASAPSRTRSAPLAAYLRCLDPGVKYQAPAIGRVIVAPAYRGAGLGGELMREGIARARARWAADDIMIGAQLRLESFYAALGFQAEGRPYLEDGIDHIEMRLRSTVRRPGEESR